MDFPARRLKKKRTEVTPRKENEKKRSPPNRESSGGRQKIQESAGCTGRGKETSRLEKKVEK